ncbi:MAG: YdiU family protein [Myxococcales bacterium]|nr:YdiU family protein [Myxococcales bacterium]
MSRPALPWTFDDRFVRELPADPETSNHPRTVLESAFTRVQPTPVADPTLVVGSVGAAAQLGLPPEVFDAPDFVATVGGNAVQPGMDPYSACYGGHQFGHWAGQLGDGRAITLGEVVAPDDQRIEIQLKGAGRTPYSRGADGRAVLRSSIREFLCSEAMHHLGVPTTRALSLVRTGDQVLRDMFYDGRAAMEPGAIVCRTSPSFLRFGTYQIFAARRDAKTLQKVVDHTLRWHFPEIDREAPDALVQWLCEVARRTAHLVVHWQRVGFVHGVLNTDNLSILGLTIDYGPYGWMDGFDPDFTPNTTDAQRRRYRYAHQPGIGAWNLARLAESISLLMEDPEPLQQVLDTYAATFGPAFLQMMLDKLGLKAGEREADAAFIDELMGLFRGTETDMTLFYRGLADLDVAEGEAADDRRLQQVSTSFYAVEAPQPLHRPSWARWLAQYAARVRSEASDPQRRREAMNGVNPKFVLRNYLAQVAIDKAEEGDDSEVEKLLQIVSDPYSDQPQTDDAYSAKRPEWARHKAGCSMLSCSS